MAVTLDQLIYRVRFESDTRGVTSRFSDSDITLFINSELGELHDLLANRFEDQIVTTVTASVTASVYDLPLDCYMLRGIDRNVNVGEPVPLTQVSFKERGQYLQAEASIYGCQPVYYVQNDRSAGVDQVHFMPVNLLAGNVTVTYIPSQPTLVSGSAETIGLPYTRNGWEEFVVLGAAIRLMEADDRDAPMQQIRKQKLEQRILNAASRKTATGSERMSHVHDPEVDGWW